VSELWIPAERLLSVINLHPNPTRSLAGQNCERTFRAMRSGVRKFVSLRAADSILTRLDLLEWWHIPISEGGLADIYVDGMQYGRPDHIGGKNGPAHPYSSRYKTDEERQEARCRSWREHKERQRGSAA
jgi:hypothetical protein